MILGYVLLSLCLALVSSHDFHHRKLKLYRESEGEQPRFHPEFKRNDVVEGYKYAVCDVRPNPSKPSLTDQVKGQVHFKQRLSGGKTMMYVTLSGFNSTDKNREHGFHVHAYGNIIDGCEGAGGHYNPYGSFHGSPMDDEEHRHVGDLGNIIESSDGTILTRFTDELASLVGRDNIMGRAIVVHEKRDDIGKGGDAESLKTGNAGTRVACCVITATTGNFWGAN